MFKQLTPKQQFRIDNLLSDHALKGNIKIIKKLIEIGANPTADLNTPLFNAIKGGHAELVEFFITLKINIYQDNAQTVRYAIENHALDVVKVLLKHFPAIEIEKHGFKMLESCIKYNDENILRYLVTNKINITEYKNDLLRISAKYGRVAMVKYFKDNDGDIHFEKEHALCSACYYGHFDVIKYLVEEGANINERYFEHKKEGSPLISAIDGHNKNILEIIDYFLSKGVNINSYDKGLMKAITFNTNIEVAKKMANHGMPKEVIKHYIEDKLKNVGIAHTMYEWINSDG